MPSETYRYVKCHFKLKRGLPIANKIILICNIFITHEHQILVILSRLQEQKSINGATLELKPYVRDHPYSLFFHCYGNHNVSFMDNTG